MYKQFKLRSAEQPANPLTDLLPMVAEYYGSIAKALDEIKKLPPLKD